MQTTWMNPTILKGQAVIQDDEAFLIRFLELFPQPSEEIASMLVQCSMLKKFNCYRYLVTTASKAKDLNLDDLCHWNGEKKAFSEALNEDALIRKYFTGFAVNKMIAEPGSLAYSVSEYATQEHPFISSLCAADNEQDPKKREKAIIDLLSANIPQLFHLAIHLERFEKRLTKLNLQILISYIAEALEDLKKDFETPHFVAFLKGIMAEIMAVNELRMHLIPDMINEIALYLH
jgi:hypothetical protein